MMIPVKCGCTTTAVTFSVVVFLLAYSSGFVVSATSGSSLVDESSGSGSVEHAASMVESSTGGSSSGTGSSSRNQPSALSSNGTSSSAASSAAVAVFSSSVAPGGSSSGSGSQAAEKASSQKGVSSVPSDTTTSSPLLAISSSSASSVPTQKSSSSSVAPLDEGGASSTPESSSGSHAAVGSTSATKHSSSSSLRLSSSSVGTTSAEPFVTTPSPGGVVLPAGTVFTLTYDSQLSPTRKQELVSDVATKVLGLADASQLALINGEVSSNTLEFYFVGSESGALATQFDAAANKQEILGYAAIDYTTPAPTSAPDADPVLSEGVIIAIVCAIGAVLLIGVVAYLIVSNAKSKKKEERIGFDAYADADELNAARNEENAKPLRMDEEDGFMPGSGGGGDLGGGSASPSLPLREYRSNQKNSSARVPHMDEI